MTIGLATVTFSFEGMETFEGDWAAAYEGLVQDIEHAAQEAAEAAIAEMQRNHPYTDRTGLLTEGMYVRDGQRTRLRCTKFVEFRAPYAGFVNDGTARSRPYPFLPQGVEAAQKRLDECMDDATASFCTHLQG